MEITPGIVLKLPFLMLKPFGLTNNQLINIMSKQKLEAIQTITIIVISTLIPTSSRKFMPSGGCIADVHLILE